MTILLTLILCSDLLTDLNWLATRQERFELQTIELRRLASRDLQVRLMTEGQRQMKVEQLATEEYQKKLSELRQRTGCEKCNLDLNGNWTVQK